jgi:hypothetical protein
MATCSPPVKILSTSDSDCRLAGGGPGIGSGSLLVRDAAGRCCCCCCSPMADLKAVKGHAEAPSRGACSAASSAAARTSQRLPCGCCRRVQQPARDTPPDPVRHGALLCALHEPVCMAAEASALCRQVYGAVRNSSPVCLTCAHELQGARVRASAAAPLRKRVAAVIKGPRLIS